jgi:hypothetical protein
MAHVPIIINSVVLQESSSAEWIIYKISNILFSLFCEALSDMFLF